LNCTRNPTKTTKTASRAIPCRENRGRALDWIPPIITFFLALVSALLIEFAKSHFQRKQRIEDRRAEFQRARLVELVDSSRDASRFLNDFYFVRQADYLRFGQWPFNPEDETGVDMTQEERGQLSELLLAFTTASGLIGDPRVVEQIQNLQSAIVTCVYAEEQKPAYDALEAGRAAYSALFKRIGELIRSL
jgi:hypothetical protein